MKPIKHVLSVIAVAVFLIMAVASSNVNKLHCGAFNTNAAANPKNTDKKNFVVKNDGSTIYGEEINWRGSTFVKNQVDIDGQKFKTSDIKGFQKDGIYYGRKGTEFIKRIIHGKLNVYMQEYSGYQYDARTNRQSRVEQCYQYIQKGETGEITPLASIKDIEEAVADCPKAAGLIDMNYKQLRRAIREDNNYLNNVFDVYNNECKPKKTSTK